jgi:hypothetical protein
VIPISTRDYLEAAFADAGLVELRHLHERGATSGLFDNVDDLLAAAHERSGYGNLYTSLNAPKLRMVTNTWGSAALKDDDIAFIVRLPFDFDPIRPRDLCSTDDELASALACRDRFVREMHARGWPLPLVGMSGNGAHALYYCRLPNNAETREALAAIYSGLVDEAGYELVTFDRTVRNPSRIFRLYGTTNRKGPDLEARPHRVATLAGPQEWRQVTRKQVMALANRFARRPSSPASPLPRSTAPVTGDGDYRSLDVVRWFQAHGHYKRPSPDGGGKHYVTCPWLAEHSTGDHLMKTDTVIWQADGGWPTFHCSHDHCADRGLRDVMTVWGDADAFCADTWRAMR